MAASPGRIAAGKKGREALEKKYGPNWPSVLGKMGGRPNFWQALEKTRAAELRRKPARRRGCATNPTSKGERR